MEDNIIFLGFADNKIPEFKEVRSREYILYGEDNKFPIHLLYLFGKSSNHGAIVGGKAKYIFGEGFPIEGTGLEKVNRFGETINDVSKKLIFDAELFSGWYLEIIWNAAGTGFEVLHMPFQDLRKGKEGGWFHSEDWTKANSINKPTRIPSFDVNNPKGSQIFAYREYRPGARQYPLPGYMAALNDIETDVEISKYNLSTIKNGMFGGKMVTFVGGDFDKNKKDAIETAWNKKFNGSENSGKTMMVFLQNGQAAPTVEDLSTTDLDKLFDQLNKTTQAEIFTGHEVTSPMLFGVKTEGQLGGRDEIATAYEIFKNTYVNTKQQSFERAIKFIFPYFGVQSPLKLTPVRPVGFSLSNDKLADMVPKEWLFEQLGIDISKYPGATDSTATQQGMVNEHLKNLSGKQNQALQRIIRQYNKQQITREQAAQMLRVSLAMDDDTINSWLGGAAFGIEYTEDQVAEMFAAVGEHRENFSIVKTKAYCFAEHYDEFADIKQTDSDILNLIGKDKRITPEIIASVLKIEPSYVSSRLRSLEKAGVLLVTTETIGTDIIPERKVNQQAIDTRVAPETVDVSIKYSYEPRPGLEPIIETTRPFCRKLLALNRLYTRAEIESISQRVGYSVFDREGGFWGEKHHCRHEWKKNIVIKKR